MVYKKTLVYVYGTNFLTIFKLKVIHPMVNKLYCEINQINCSKKLRLTIGN